MDNPDTQSATKRKEPSGRSLVRRPIKARDTRWAPALARVVARAGITPNQVSLFGVFLALLAGAALLFAPSRPLGLGVALYVLAAFFIQGRLLCNLIDGLVAVEGGRGTKSGEMFNDLPDRISDAAVLAAAGYSLTWLSWGRDLGWIAALLAVLTAYVRVLGGASGVPQHFVGPMAKQQRMAIVTIGCLAAAVERGLGYPQRSLAIALAVVVVGCLVTIARRTWMVVRDLEAR